ncbi:PfkB family carbohydrate kinase [Acidaminobacter sp. JC074]|uniref:PfkB family carbohydrate kinase n=1 Tax=Acidaminobacter sp. JC074 TaxID=2530199 RepID=UPI001F100024|nr:PfkB family carbohydrate kinase [Acidaminobacter sp. JC074]
MKRALFVGITGLDYVYYLDKHIGSNEKTKTNDYKSYIGGPAANAAITYCLLGGRAKLLTHIGDSLIGTMIKDQLRSYDIEIIDLAEGKDILPFVSSIHIDGKGDRTVISGQNLIADDFEDFTVFKDVNCVLLDCNLPNVSLQVLRNCSLPSVLDAGSWKAHMGECMSLATDVIAYTNCTHPEKNLKDFVKKNLAITDNEKSFYYRDSDSSGWIDPIKVKVHDTLGAGDVFHGAYCYYRYLKKLNFKTALESASKVAAYSVTQRGVVDGVKFFLNNHRE